MIQDRNIIVLNYGSNEDAKTEYEVTKSKSFSGKWNTSNTRQTPGHQQTTPCNEKTELTMGSWYNVSFILRNFITGLES